MLKVDNIFKVFNARRQSKEDMQSNLSTLSFESNVMNDGRILIYLHLHTQNSSRCTIDWMASGNVPNWRQSKMWNDFNFTNFNSWSHSSTISKFAPAIWSFIRGVHLQISAANAWPYNFQLGLPHNPLVDGPTRLRY